MIKGIVHHTLIISVAIISMMLLYSSMLKFLDPMWENQFAVWGYSTTFLYIVGASELVLGILIFAKPTRIYGLLGLFVLLAGALYTHISNNEFEEIYTAIFLIGLSISCLILIWFESKIDTEKLK